MGCHKRYAFSGIMFLLLSLPLSAGSLLAGEQSVSTEVQANITVLKETRNCPECNLSGANLNRMDLSGANLQGANLSRAKMFLTDLSDANLQNSDLRGAQFGGADLANADLRGADLTGASLAGAFMGGTLLDGEMVTTNPYVEDEIADVEETVYVEDTVKPKSLQETEDMVIGSRRDFEETPPSVLVEVPTPETLTMETPLASGQENDITPDKAIGNGVPEQSVISPAVKEVPIIQEVRIQEKEAAPQVLLIDNTKKQLSQNDTTALIAKVEEPVVDAKIQEKVKMEPAPQQKSAVETVATNPVVQEVTDNGQTKLQEEADVAVSAQMQEENEKTDGVESTVASQTAAVPIGINSDGKSDKGIPEEIDTVIETVEEAKEKISVHGPGDEILQNIEILLDTNQCYGCNLAGADLSGKNLEDADLEGADLSNALLQNADLEGANLKGANLSGADLSEADLSEADLYKAVLTGADLTNTDLEGTFLDDADLSGVKGYKETMLLMEEN